MTSAWVLAIALIVVGGMAAIVVVHLWGSDAQEQATITAIVTFAGPTVAALLALFKAHENGAKVDTLTRATNGSFAELWSATRRAGVVEGRRRERTEPGGSDPPARSWGQPELEE